MKNLKIVVIFGMVAVLNLTSSAMENSLQNLVTAFNDLSDTLQGKKKTTQPEKPQEDYKYPSLKKIVDDARGNIKKVYDTESIQLKKDFDTAINANLTYTQLDDQVQKKFVGILSKFTDKAENVIQDKAMVAFFSDASMRELPIAQRINVQKGISDILYKIQDSFERLLKDQKRMYDDLIETEISRQLASRTQTISAASKTLFSSKALTEKGKSYANAAGKELFDSLTKKLDQQLDNFLDDPTEYAKKFTSSDSSESQ